MTGNDAEKGIGAYEETSCERDAGAFEVVARPDVGEVMEGGVAGVAHKDGVAREVEEGDEL